LKGTLEAESEGVKEVFADRGAGVSKGEPVVETLGNLIAVWSTGGVGTTMLFERVWDRDMLDVESSRTDAEGVGCWDPEWWDGVGVAS